MLHWVPLFLTCALQSAPEQEALSAGPPPVQAAGPEFVDGQVIVRFRAPTSIDQAAVAIGGARYVVDRALEPELDMYLVLIGDGTGVEDASAELSAHPSVLYAVPDAKVHLRSTVPNDPSFGTQWNMHNTGQSGGKVDADIDAIEAWDLGTGDAQYVVAIVDGGGQHTHVDLLANRWQNDAEVGGVAGVDDDANGYVDDLYGWNAYSNNGTIPTDSHGTHVAGIASARGNNATGVAGVNWNARLMYVAGASGTTSTVVTAYSYVRKQRELWLQTGGAKGANVVATNSSFGVDYANCNTATYQPWNDMYEAMGALGILSAAATINAHVNVDVIGDVPTGCASEYMVAVTNTDRNDNKASAGYGALTIDLGAPGTSVYSTVPTNSYASYTGTSMASPHVCGAIAFLHSVASPAFKGLFASSPDQAALVLKTVMLQNVDVIPSLNNITVSDGRLNLHKAGLAMQAWGCANPVTVYCTAKVNSLGCTPSIAMSSAPSASLGSGCPVTTSNVLGVKNGLYFHSTTGASATPFHGGFLCLQSPIKRHTVINSGGSAGSCSGSYVEDFNAYIASGVDPALVVGATVWIQTWSRDPADPFADGLSDAVTAAICP